MDLSSLPRRSADRRSKSSRVLSEDALTAYLLLLPGLIFYVPFHVSPILAVFVFSLVDWKGYSFATMEWAGLENYVKLATDEFFWKALGHNLQFVVIVVLLQTVIALALALVLEQKFPLSTFFRGVYFMPTVLSLVVVGILFSLILSPSTGLLNAFLRAIGLSNIQPSWLGDPGIALYAVMFVQLWKNFGLSMFIYIAGLQAIPSELLDAAKVDGASGRQIVWWIIIPLLRESTTVVVVLGTISCFKLFDLIFAMTGGGPFFSTEVLAVRMYKQAFNLSRMGYGSATAVVLFLITFGVSATQTWLRGRGGEVEY